ncbi:MAG: TMEM175 family protein [Caulobacteraceae bacterium]
MAGEPESLDTDEGLERRRHRHWFDRLLMLSDGVFAIAMTLLAFDLHGPAVWDGRLASLWANLAPQLDAFALSFVVIGVYWLAHRRFMAMILTVDAPVTVLNLVVLAFVTLVPAATRLTHGYGTGSPTMLVYGALVIAIGAVLAVFWGYAALVADLVSPEIPRRVRWFLLGLMVFTPPFFLLLVMAVPRAGPGVAPLSLAILFLIGWPVRLWVLRRLAPGGPAR